MTLTLRQKFNAKCIDIPERPSLLQCTLETRMTSPAAARRP